MITTSITKTLDETDKKIVALISDGNTSKKIARELNLSAHTISARIREMKKYYKCQSTAQLLHRLSLVT